MWIVQTAPFQLVKGTQYAAALKLSWSENEFATNDLVAKKFTDVGFTSVTVDLPNKRVEGVWSGDDQVADLPPEVIEVWAWAL